MSAIQPLDAAAAEDVMVEVDAVHKRFGATQALAGVSCTFERTEFVALLGPNGAGKSTLIKILDGVYTADAGAIRVRGGRRGLGVVHQDLGLVDTMTVAENVAIGTDYRRTGGLIDWRATARQAIRALEVMGSTVAPDTLVGRLAAADKSMIAIARAHGMTVMVGCMIESSIGITAAAHFTPLVDIVDLDGAALLAEDPFVGATIDGGQVSLPSGPGLGVRRR